MSGRSVFPLRAIRNDKWWKRWTQKLLRWKTRAKRLSETTCCSIFTAQVARDPGAAVVARTDSMLTTMRTQSSKCIELKAKITGRLVSTG
ncbi:hypothetical protein CDAR_262461 [Caerostris darwini]|uniref:Uncharacterized protein n=1 Tax=Caerostris darwini TaxID=1538125 RepID=A0AAV4TW46_9ARAC|nr:hypothetical protein CDAR_262461 [Caerostris darwini]